MNSDNVKEDWYDFFDGWYFSKQVFQVDFDSKPREYIVASTKPYEETNAFQPAFTYCFAHEGMLYVRNTEAYESYIPAAIPISVIEYLFMNQASIKND